MAINAQLRSLTAREFTVCTTTIDRRRVIVSFNRPGETFRFKALKAMIELQAHWAEEDLRRLTLLNKCGLLCHSLQMPRSLRRMNSTRRRVCPVGHSASIRNSASSSFRPDRYRIRYAFFSGAISEC